MGSTFKLKTEQKAGTSRKTYYIRIALYTKVNYCTRTLPPHKTEHGCWTTWEKPNVTLRPRLLEEYKPKKEKKISPMSNTGKKRTTSEYNE